MKISQINNTNFGYNKKLNQKLNKRLEESPSTPVMNLIANMNSVCNSTESDIVRLEDSNYGGIDRNEDQINILLSSFLGAKRNLAMLVDRVFPELNFSKKTMDTLDSEYLTQGPIYKEEKLHIIGEKFYMKK